MASARAICSTLFISAVTDRISASVGAATITDAASTCAFLFLKLLNLRMIFAFSRISRFTFTSLNRFSAITFSNASRDAFNPSIAASSRALLSRRCNCYCLWEFWAGFAITTYWCRSCHHQRSPDGDQFPHSAYRFGASIFSSDRSIARALPKINLAYGHNTTRSPYGSVDHNFLVIYENP